MTMRLAGTPTLKDINSKFIITHNLSQHYTRVPKDYLNSRTYEKMDTMYSKL